MAEQASKPLVIINSGAYVVDELAAEFGALPPTFVPVGVSRLYELQAQMLAGIGGEIILTLPESFDVTEWDLNRLEELGITLVKTRDGQSLGLALLSVLGSMGFPERPLRLLHGDTLLPDQDCVSDDVIAVAKGGDGYNWSYAQLDSQGNIVRILPSYEACEEPSLRICGYFAFASTRHFGAALASAHGNFLDALNWLVDRRELKASVPINWLDFGHLQTFFRSRRIVTTQRSFNALEIGPTYVRKSSVAEAHKLRNEARWLSEVPAALQPFCARLIECGPADSGYFYSTEYEYLSTLAELFVFGRLNRRSWDRILSSCNEFLETSMKLAPSDVKPGLLRGLVVDKTIARLKQFAATIELDLAEPLKINGKAVPSLMRMIERIDEILVGSRDVPSIMHGDFCFSNIMYSFRTERIRLIDPRAMTQSGTYSLGGDARYDLGKLMHSMVGGYDLIIAGQYAARRESQYTFSLTIAETDSRRALESVAYGCTMAGLRLTSPDIWASMISLFLSMPPLHADRPERQIAFLANALRLFVQLDHLS